MHLDRRSFFVVIVFGALTLVPNWGLAESLADRFFSSQSWTSLLATVEWSQPGTDAPKRVEFLAMNDRGDQAFWAWPEGISPSAAPDSVSLFKGKRYFAFREGAVSADGIELSERSVRAALLRLLNRGAAVKRNARIVATAGQSFQMRWGDWKSSPVLEVSLDSNGRLSSARDLSATVTLGKVAYGLADSKVYIQSFELATDDGRAQGMTVTGAVRTNRAVLSDVRLDSEQGSRWFQLP